MAHETENILGWTIFAIMDGGGPGPMVTMNLPVPEPTPDDQEHSET